MFFGRMFLDKLFNIKDFILFETGMQCISEFLRFDVLLKSKIHICIVLGVKNIVTFFLGKVLPELVFHVVDPGMTLDTEVSAVEGVEKVETYGKFETEAFKIGSQHVFGMGKHQEIEAEFGKEMAAAHHKPVFRHNQLKGPCVVFNILFQTGDVFHHPVSTPYTGLKPGSDAEYIPAHCKQGLTKIISLQPDRDFILIIHQKVDFLQDFGFMPV